MDDFDPPVNELSVVTDTVAVQVAADGVGGVQLCPAILIGSPQALPSASKHIYSRLAANANELDEGMPDLILSLVSHGNQLSRKYLSLVESALSPIVSSCGLWLISSGEHEDPLARAASNTIRNVLPQTDTPVEVLHLLINSHRVVGVSSAAECCLVDTSLNTLLLACRRDVEEEGQLARMRAHAAVRLAHPPPALLIGVPSEHISSGMTPSGQAPPILLSPSNDRIPLSVAIFAGASASSLDELLIFVENGVPVVILQDSCELCSILHSATLLYRTSDFEHERFVLWLRDQLHAISMNDVIAVADVLVRILSIAMGDPQLIEFVESDELSSLSSTIVDLCVQCYPGDTRQVVLLAGRLNQPSALNRLPLGEILDDELLTSLLCQSVSRDNHCDFLSAVLETRPHLNLHSEMLIKMLNATDQHFFSSIVLCHCMGYSVIPTDIDDSFAYDLNKTLRRLSFGVDDLFAPSAFNGDVLHKENAASIRILAIWSLLLHRPRMTQCLCAFSEEPLAFSLVLSRIARSLSHEARDWCFYSDSLLQLSRRLSQSAVSLLESVHSSCPTKAYQMLCQPMDAFHNQTITQLAFQSNCRLVVSHESCQRWVHRLLYGHLQARNDPIIVPSWMKIALSAFLLLPIRWWMSIQPPVSSQKEDYKSPTVCLLDTSRQPKRTRAVSTYSVVSGRSDALTTITAPMSVNVPMHQFQFGSGGESATPQSMVLPLSIEEADGGENSMRFFTKKTRIRRSSPPSLALFYSTPIVKYWLSLTFRILHIAFLAYATLLPGCGSRTLDAIVWAWSFMWWMESLWVLHLRTQTTDLSLMPWRVFDVCTTFVFLLLLLLLKVFGEGPVAQLFYLPSVYPARVISAIFLLYWCYATLFCYIPLSDVYGPLMVRVKLMILRDFTNFLIMIALIMVSSAIAIQAIVFPDREVSVGVLRSALSWAWLSLFTTDMSSLKESDTCRKSFLGAPKDYCSSVGGYGNSTCPSQSWPAYFVIIEYFVLLKLILWPILFAFFAKTAKAVEDEADQIWKYQMYSLVTDFSMRPPLPPPLSPLFFVFLACCRTRSRLYTMSFTALDHPDMAQKGARTTMRFGSVYRNPSVPFKKNEFVNAFWRQLAIDHWREETQRKTASSEGSLLKTVHQQLRMIALTSAYKKTEGKLKETPLVPYSGSSSVSRLSISREEQPWTVLLPRYDPPFYCKPMEEFAPDMARYVETASEQCVQELRRAWRSRQVAEQGGGAKGWTLSAAGFPLNPVGRRGIAGRGNHPRFGANKKCCYVIITGMSRSGAKILLDDSGSLPCEPHPEGGAKDERLANLLKLIGITESDAQVLSMRRLDTAVLPETHRVPPTDTSPAHISVDTVQSEDDTDNAWTEYDVWAVALRSRKVVSSLIGFEWREVTSLSSIQHGHVAKALKVFGIE